MRVKNALPLLPLVGKDAGVAERACLESTYMGNCIGGSNPPLSANDNAPHSLLRSRSPNATSVRAEDVQQ